MSILATIGAFLGFGLQGSIPLKSRSTKMGHVPFDLVFASGKNYSS